MSGLFKRFCTQRTHPIKTKKSLKNLSAENFIKITRIKNPANCRVLKIYSTRIYNAPTSAMSGISTALYKPASNFFFVSSKAFKVISISSKLWDAVGINL